MTGYQWSCGVQGSYRCERNGSGKPPAKCRECGGWIVSRVGQYGVFAWTGDNRYPLDKAVKLYASPKVAEKRADALNHEPWPADVAEGYVVRFVASSRHEVLEELDR